MKKTVLILAFALLTFCSSFAKDVDMTTAMNVAKNFYTSKATIKNNFDKQSLTLSLAYKYNLATSSSSAKSLTTEGNAYYIFNVNANDGFVIIAGDDIVKPVLGYSNEGTYDGNNLPPAFQEWMENYSAQILFAKQNNVQATVEIKNGWDELINNTYQKKAKSIQTVNPLLSTTWNQSPYYNALCPGGSVTGCVATAMAQIMKFWNYPATGTGFHQYNHATYGTQSANFAATTYNWGAMPNNVTSSNSAVATLMYQCGVSVDMDYSPTGSSAYVIALDNAVCAENSYKTYFGYDATTIHGYQRASYTTTVWKNLLKTDLNNNQPIQYAGFGQNGGHTFVCDGYDANDFFHMNWGWGGQYSNYFDLDALTPSTHNYTDGQQAVIGIKPAVITGNSTIDMYSSITINPNPIGFAQAFTVNADVINNGTNSFSGNFCAALFTSNGDFVDYVQTLSASSQPLQPGYHYTGGLTFSNTGVLAVPGNYIIGIYYQDPNGNWYLAGDANYTNPVGVVINSPIDYIQLYSSITATPTTFVQGQAASVNVNLINDNTATYYGQYSAVLYDLSGNFVETIGTYTETLGLPAGYTYSTPYITFSTASITAAPGTYILAIQELENGFSTSYLVGGQYYSQPINIDVVAPSLSPDIYEVNNTQATAYTLPLTWAGNTSHRLTTGSNIHITTDNDYYKINLASGYNYTITARVHDSYNSSAGTFTCDVLWDYNTGSGWSPTYDDIMPGNIVVNGAGTVYFFVAPYFTGLTGTYLLDITINRVSTVGIDELNISNIFEIYPNPASNNLNIRISDFTTIDKLKLLNILGQTISETTPTQSITQFDLTGIKKGMYFIEAIENGKTYSMKFIINQ